MQKVQPLLQEIQTKFADDPVRQREEMQRLYAETKFNPLAGCLPMLIQMPVFIALYQVLYSMVVSYARGMTYQFYHLVPDLTKNPATDLMPIGVAAAGGFFIFAVIQQQLTMHFLKKKDAEEEAVAEVAPVKIDVTRKVKKPRPTKKR